MTVAVRREQVPARRLAGACTADAAPTLQLLLKSVPMGTGPPLRTDYKLRYALLLAVASGALAAPDDQVDGGGTVRVL